MCVEWRGGFPLIDRPLSLQQEVNLRVRLAAARRPPDTRRSAAQLLDDARALRDLLDWERAEHAENENDAIQDLLAIRQKLERRDPEGAEQMVKAALASLRAGWQRVGDPDLHERSELLRTECERLARELALSEEQCRLANKTIDKMDASISRLRGAMMTARQQIQERHGKDWAIDTLRDALNDE